MKSPAELAARLRKMVLAAQHHYSPTGEPLRSIVVTPEWLEDMAEAAFCLELLEHASKQPTLNATYAPLQTWREHSSATGFPMPSLDELTQKFGDLPEVSGKVVSINKI